MFLGVFGSTTGEAKDRSEGLENALLKATLNWMCGRILDRLIQATLDHSLANMLK